MVIRIMVWCVFNLGYFGVEGGEMIDSGRLNVCMCGSEEGSGGLKIAV